MHSLYAQEPIIQFFPRVRNMNGWTRYVRIAENMFLEETCLDYNVKICFDYDVIRGLYSPGAWTNSAISSQTNFRVLKIIGENRNIHFSWFCKTFWLIKNCFTMKCEWIIFKGLLRLYDHISTVCEPNFQNEALLKLQVQHFKSSKWCWILNATCTMHIS